MLKSTYYNLNIKSNISITYMFYSWRTDDLIMEKVGI